MLVPRSGLIGKLYRAWHERRGCEIFLRGPAELRREAEECGWRLVRVLRAGPLAFAFLFSEAALGGP